MLENLVGKHFCTKCAFFSRVGLALVVPSPFAGFAESEYVRVKHFACFTYNFMAQGWRHQRRRRLILKCKTFTGLAVCSCIIHLNRRWFFSLLLLLHFISCLMSKRVWCMKTSFPMYFYARECVCVVHIRWGGLRLRHGWIWFELNHT